ncbi:hypothetical protein [Streptomyces sp. Act143]|uniref:hypothetical protein n=1 Tax=Streptomyces sp. Act143 TaxID=2200760 RepID=UPI0015E7E91D|nr:hypothetical protein [Streptomyces sp. Act143]
MAFFTFRHAEFTFDRVQHRELDGDPVTSSHRLSVETSPGAPVMRLPAREE